MRKIATLFFTLGLIGMMYAQDEHEMIVESSGVGILEQTIFGDTMPTGERMDPDRVYVLRRATPYLLSEIIDVADFHLRIKAEDGDGTRPILILNVGDGADPIDQMMVASSGGHITLDGLHLTGQDIFGNKTLRIIRVNGDRSRVSLNDCVLDDTGQSGFRLNADSIKVFISNSIINRMGQFNSPDNGRFLDNRGHPIDSLWVTNCVVYDITSRIYRNGSNSYLHHAAFNQCTFFGSGQWGFSFSPADELTFTNNIVANPVFLGYAGDQRYAMTIDTFRDGDQIDVSYNNFFTSPAFDEALPEMAMGGSGGMNGDTVRSVNGNFFGPQISLAMAASASSTTNFSEVLEFANAPEAQQDLISNTYDSTVMLSNQWDFSDLTPDAGYSVVGGTLAVDRYSTFHDFSYSENAQSYTAGNNGQKIGADLANLDTDVKEDFFVRDNILFYPNPVRSELFIQNLDEADLHSIQIYDLKGVSIINQKVRASNTVIQLPDAPAGTYILTIRDKSGKISSRKIMKN